MPVAGLLLAEDRKTNSAREEAAIYMNSPNGQMFQK